MAWGRVPSRRVLAASATACVLAASGAASAQSTPGEMRIGEPVQTSVPAPAPPRELPPPRPYPYTGGPIPPGTHLERHPIRELEVAGALIFLPAYLLPATIGFIGGFLAPPAWWLMVPVAGPELLLAAAPTTDATTVGVMIADSVLQAGGLACWIIGGVVRQPWVVPHLVLGPPARGVRLALLPGVPLAGPRAAGVTLALTDF